MFDASTGTLRFEQPPTVIAPSLTRDRFLVSSLADEARSHIANGTFHSWKLNGTFRSSGLDLLVVLWFHDQHLTMVSLMDPDPRFGTSWDDHSLENEMARKASHDVWLARALAPHRNFAWGSVLSGYDERGGFSNIVVKYAVAG
ncbi:MAG: hypothetical protein ACRC8S_12585 [Fimbriiglobus sp.]